MDCPDCDEVLCNACTRRECEYWRRYFKDHPSQDGPHILSPARQAELEERDEDA